MLTCTFLEVLPTEASTTTLGQGKARRSLFLLLMLPCFKVDLTSLSDMCLHRSLLRRAAGVHLAASVLHGHNIAAMLRRLKVQ